MSLSRIKALMIHIAIFSFLLGSVAHADRVERRASVIESSQPQEIGDYNLRLKIIRSRALILYLQDLLPNSGNPYTHLAEHAANVTKDTFKASQKNGSSHMNVAAPDLWLPADPGEVWINPPGNEDRKAVADYFLLFNATVQLLQKTLLPVLQNSIIVGRLSELVDPSVTAKFDHAWAQVSWINAAVNQAIAKHPALINQQKDVERKAILLLAGEVAKAMKSATSDMVDASDPTEAIQFLSKIEDLAKSAKSKSSVVELKQQWQSAFADSSRGFRAAKSLYESVDLPESGDIDGSQAAFETVMRLDLGFDILKVLNDKINETW